MVTQWSLDIVPFARLLHHSNLCHEKVVSAGLEAGLKVVLRMEQK